MLFRSQANAQICQRVSHSSKSQKQKQRVKAIHAKIKNTRQDLIHKFTTQLVKDNALIVVGDVKTTQFNSKKGKLAKSVYDAGWFELKRQLTYKCENAGCRFEIVNERYTTQTCSCCGQIDSNSPKGRAGLRIRDENELSKALLCSFARQELRLQ